MRTASEQLVYVTDHSADQPDYDSEVLARMLGTAREARVNFLRYDWRWNRMELRPGDFEQAAIDRYAEVAALSQALGFLPPTIILSSPPKWAKELFRKDRRAFLLIFERYVTAVAEGMTHSGGEVGRVQLFNEINNRAFFPIEPKDLADLSKVVRRVLPHKDIVVSVLAQKPIYGTPIMQYLRELRHAAEFFDTVAVDYYPGSWHWQLRGSHTMNPRALRQYAIHQFGLLERTFEVLSSWQEIQYEVGETGSFGCFPFGAQGQLHYLEAFFEQYQSLLNRFVFQKRRGPSAIGLYQLRDEDAFKWGLFTERGHPKPAMMTDFYGRSPLAGLIADLKE